MNYSISNRLNATDLVLFNGQSTYGYWNLQSILTQQLDPADLISVQVTASIVGRPDLIAKKYYNISELDWLVVAFNAMSLGENNDPTALDVFGWPKVGAVIVIPSQRVVSTMLR